MFGKQERKGIPIQGGEIGPGHYKPALGKWDKGGWTMARKHRPRTIGEVPGPGKYNSVKDSKYKRFKENGVKFGRTERRGFGGEGTDIGPGSYSVGPKKGRGGWSFGRDARKGLKGSDIPGPGSYKPNDFKVKFGLSI